MRRTGVEPVPEAHEFACAEAIGALRLCVPVPMVRPLITSKTPLSELRTAVRDGAPRADNLERLVRNIEQSLRVEGYVVSRSDIETSAMRALRLASK